MSCGNIITIWALLIGSSQAGNCYYGMEEAASWYEIKN